MVAEHSDVGSISDRHARLFALREFTAALGFTTEI